MVSRGLKTFVLIGFVTLLASHSSLAAADPATVTLAWYPSPSPGVAGYRLYSGTESQVYVDILDVGSATLCILTNLTPGTTYFVAVTAYDFFGLESPFSTELSFAAPTGTNTPAKLRINFGPGPQVTLSGSAPAGYSYDVLASQTLSNWTSIGTLTADALGTFLFVDDREPTNAVGLYRLRQRSP